MSPHPANREHTLQGARQKLGVRVRSVCLARASPWPLNQHVWISRRGTCFWDGRSCMHVQRSVKSVRRKAKCTHFVERVRECERVFKLHRTRRYSRLSRRPRALFASLGAAALFRTHRSRRGPYGVEAAFTLCLLRFCARLLALPRSDHLLLFWRRDNETASAATALRTINLRKCTQLFVNRIF